MSGIGDQSKRIRQPTADGFDDHIGKRQRESERQSSISAVSTVALLMPRSDSRLRVDLITPEQIAASERQHETASIASVIADLDGEFG